MLRHLLISLLVITVVSAILAPGFNVRGGGRRGGFGSSSSSSSSEDDGYGHGHHHHHGRPPGRPRPPLPPRPNDPEPDCDVGWMVFNRPQGTWCVKVFYGDGTKYTSENLCQTQGATLTGLQDASERFQIANAGRILANQNGGGLSEVWIGAVRKAACQTRTSCTPNDTFEWTDGHTTGTAGFYYPGLEPNAYYIAGWGNQDCLELHVSVADGVAARYGYSHGDLDDQHCQQSIRMYACGKVPL